MRAPTRRTALAAALALLVALALLCPAWASTMQQRSFSDEELAAMKEAEVLINTDLGTIRLRFFPDVAPNHVYNFLDLAARGFYDGTVFHWVKPGFIIQGGDPNTRGLNRLKHGLGGPGYSLAQEQGGLTHKKGSLSMVRTASGESSGSQFFICIEDSPHLDGQYTVLGQVVQGMNVAVQIAAQPSDSRQNPLQRVAVKIRVLWPEQPQ